MRLLVDLAKQRFIVGAGTSQEIETISVKRGPATEIEIQFLGGTNGITPQELSSDASGIFEVKTALQFDSSPLTAALAWTKTGTGTDTLYTFTLPLVNDPLDLLLGVDPLYTFTTTFGTDSFNDVAHGLTALTPIQFSTTVTLPAPLLPNTTYYVSASGLTADIFKVSASSGGSVVNLTTDGTGIHSWRRISNDIASVTLMAAMQWEADGRTNETQTIDFVLLNDVVREGEIPPAFPAIVYGLFLPEIETLADFKAVPTIGYRLGTIVEVLIDIAGVPSWLTFRLTTGPTAIAEPGDVEPDDYDLSTNDVHWHGASGPSGGAGVSAGLRYKWNTATSGAPGSGKLLGTNATLASIVQLNISEVDQDSNALAAYIATFDDSTSTIKGRLLIQDPATPTNFAIFAITGSMTDAGVYDTFAGTITASGGSLTNNLPVQLSFWPTGDKGLTGDSGFLYVYNTATSGDPGTGKFLFDNATFASATQFNISETDANANGLSALLASIDNSSSANKCLVLIQKQGGLSLFAFYVTAVLTDVGAYDTFAITPIGTSGSFSNLDECFVSFIRVGDAGSVGAPGLKYKFNTATSGDPGTGKLLLNNATLASVTSINIKETDDDGNAIASLLATWDDSTSTVKGKLFIYDRATPTNFAIYNITGTITDAGTYDTFTLAYVIKGGAFTNNLALTVLFIPTGDDGGTTYSAAAAIGAGTTGVDIDLTALSMTTARVLTNNTDFDLINLVNGKVTIIHIKQAAANSYTATMNGTIKWMGTGGVHPIQSPGFNTIDTWTIWYDGTNVYGAWSPGE